MVGIYRAADRLGVPVSVMVINVMMNGVHWHDHVEILYCVRGEMHVRIDGLAHRLRERDFVTVDGGVSHEIYDGEPGNLQIICSIDRKMLGDMEGQSICCSTLGGGIAKEDAALIRQARADSIDRIFFQRQYPRSTVETIARDMGAEAVEIDPLREDVFRNIAEITDLIAARR